ncbi:MAG: hypothetical protein P8M20_00615 [Planctomycetaceae bacterium]|nr:hypothetical protein [Planctomycetaceae bacterium]
MNVRVKLAIAFLAAGLFAGVIAILLPRSNDDHDQTFTAAAIEQATSRLLSAENATLNSTAAGIAHGTGQ